MGKKAIKATMGTPAIIGVFEGEALDCRITNKNGLDITDEVIDNVIASEEYEEGIKYGWFIGFLGHPEDPACQEFQNGCIVLTEMRRESNGKVYAKFNLIDTPVGQIVKKFIDAGVTFGISIRGAGDIIGNAVDPDTFMFRGFDLVAFPAYPESVPTFTEIAASTDQKTRQQYQAICAAVNDNLNAITSASAIEVLQAQFAPQSAEYQALEDRKNAIGASVLDLDRERIEAMTDAYILCLRENDRLKSDLKDSKSHNKAIESSYSRKLKSLERITRNQTDDILSSLDAEEKSKRIIASKLSRQTSELNSLKNSVQSLKKSNLIYKQRITASEQSISDKEKVIGDLRKKLRETVTASTKAQNHTSNLDADNRKLSEELIECQELLKSFQTAYANMYANALGVNSMNISISSHTTVEDIHSLIEGSMNTCNIAAQPDVCDLYMTNGDDNEIISI